MQNFGPVLDPFLTLSGAADLLIFCTLSGPLIVNKMKQISARYLISFSSNGGKTANFSSFEGP